MYYSTSFSTPVDAVSCKRAGAGTPTPSPLFFPALSSCSLTLRFFDLSRPSPVSRLRSAERFEMWHKRGRYATIAEHGAGENTNGDKHFHRANGDVDEIVFQHYRLDTPLVIYVTLPASFKNVRIATGVIGCSSHSHRLFGTSRRH